MDSHAQLNWRVCTRSLHNLTCNYIIRYELTAWKAATSVCTHICFVSVAARILSCFMYKHMSDFGICVAVRCHGNSNLETISSFQSHLGCCIDAEALII